MSKLPHSTATLIITTPKYDDDKDLQHIPNICCHVSNLSVTSELLTAHRFTLHITRTILHNNVFAVPQNYAAVRKKPAVCLTLPPGPGILWYMSNFAKSHNVYIRKLTINGPARQLTLPTALVRSSDFLSDEHVVVHQDGTDRFIVQTIASWFKERRECQANPSTDTRPSKPTK